MSIEGAASFGNYFVLPGDRAYRASATMRLPGRDNPVEAQFDFRLR